MEKETYFKILKALSLEEPLIVQQVDEESSWIDLLLKYLRSDKLPSDRKEVRKIRKQAACYVLYDDKLYMRLFSLPLLKCWHPSEADYVLREVHKEIYESHFGDRSLSYKILR